MIRLVFLVEEPSMRDLLDVLLPRLDLGVDYKVIPFQGKSDLEKNAPDRMRSWREAADVEVRFILMRDNDGSDCGALKARLVDLFPEPRGRHLVRIVMQELESWFLGDLPAVATAYEKPALARLTNKETYRNPDRLRDASEQLEKLTKDRSKRLRAARIAPHMRLDGNASRSFQVFCEGVRRLAELA